MKHCIILLSAIFSVHIGISQSVGVGTDTPDPSAALEVTSTTQGMLVPRMTTEQRNMISSPATGLLVFDINTNSFWFKGGSEWTELIDSTNAIVHRNGSNIYTGMDGNVGIGTMEPSSKLEVRTPTNTVGITHTDSTLKLVTKIQDSKALFGTQTGHDMHFIANNIARMSITQLGKVGIGTLSPNAPLQLANAFGNRRIVLWEGANNDHEFYGFGIGPSLLRYQTIGDHAFYHGIDPGTSKELMRITAAGRAGIGIASPIATLDIARGTAFEGTLLIRGTQYNSHFNYADAEHTYIRGGKTGSHVLINDAADLGNVAVGMATPANKLDIHTGPSRSGTHAAGRPLYVTGSMLDDSDGIEFRHANGTQGIGFGFNTVYAAGSNTSQHLGISAKGETGSIHLTTNGNERMRVSGNGNIGIGTSTPTQNLHVEGNGYITQKLGISVSSPNSTLDVHTGPARTGTHPSGRPLYVTGPLTFNDGIEFRHYDGTQGIGFSYNTIYAAGSNPSQSLAIVAKGTDGDLRFSTHDGVMAIAGNGNVGIGDIFPSERLSIGKGGILGGSMTTNVQIITAEGDLFQAGIKLRHGSDAYGWTLQSDDTQDKFFIKRHVNDAVGINAMAINGSNGNVGIGTVNPAELLDVNGNVKISGTLDMGYSIEFNQVMVGSTSTTSEECSCPQGTVVLGGGWTGLSLQILASQPSATGDGWFVAVRNLNPQSEQLVVWAICARLAD